MIDELIPLLLLVAGLCAILGPLAWIADRLK